MLQLLVGDAVSGTVSLPSRGAFHLSLTVLFRYRWQRVFSLRRWSSRIPTRFLVPRGTWVLIHTVIAFRLRGSHPLWLAFPNDSTIQSASCAQIGRPGEISPATPTMQRLPAITHNRFGLVRVRSPLLTESWLLSFRPAT